MTRDEITAYVADRILRRSDTDIAAAVLDGVRLAHFALQRDFDWSCQQTTADKTFADTDAALGVALDDDWKQVTEVWTVGSDGGVLPVEFTGRAAVFERSVQQETYRERGARDSEQRAYMDGRRMRLTCPPASGEAALTLRLIGLEFLPFYAIGSATDWFSVNAWDALVWGAAMQGSLTGLEDERAAGFKPLYDAAVARALAADQRFTNGAMSQGWRPPLRTPRLDRGRRF